MRRLARYKKKSYYGDKIEKQATTKNKTNYDHNTLIRFMKVPTTKIMIGAPYS